MRYLSTSIIALVLIYIICRSAVASTLVANSGTQRIQLLELYSSESCSSCPPADQWISSLKNEEGLWTRFIPLVFHVDYWNYLGWKDGFSSDTMTKRQQQIAATWATPSVYTPAIVLDGKEWRGWRHSSVPSQSERSKFELSIYQEQKDEFQVNLRGLEPEKIYTIHIALLGMDIHSEVKSGENGGQTLEHNFLVLDWKSKEATQKSKSLQFQLAPKSRLSKKLAVAAWIEIKGSPIPLQAVGAYINE